MKVQVKDLEGLYLGLKALSDELKVTGWSAKFLGVDFYKTPKENNNLLTWFLYNLHTLKQGCENMLIAAAVGDGNGYAVYEDCIYISTEKTSLGLLVIIKKELWNDNGCHDCSGRYSIDKEDKEIVFFVKEDKM
jgi:hypothetical protein